MRSLEESSRAARDPTSRAAISRRDAVHDAELVRRFNAGDEDAFVEIVTRYRGKLFSVTFCYLHNHADAEEITQDTFIRAYRGLARFRGDSSLATWLHHIALNLMRNHYWHFFRRRRHATLSLDGAFGEDNRATFSNFIASDDPTPAREATNREFLAHVMICMKKLSVQQREVLTLRNELNQSYSDIAQALGIGIGTVKSRIGRARQNLRGLLAQTYAGLEPDDTTSVQWFEPSRPSGACG